MISNEVEIPVSYCWNQRVVATHGSKDFIVSTIRGSDREESNKSEEVSLTRKFQNATVFVPEQSRHIIPYTSQKIIHNKENIIIKNNSPKKTAFQTVEKCNYHNYIFQTSPDSSDALVSAS